MAGLLDLATIQAVFQSRPDIISGIKTAADSPRRIDLFNDIAGHVYQLQNHGEPASKRRKTAEQSDGGPQAVDEAVLLEIKEVSLVMPQRKKLDLCFTANHLYARAPGTTAPMPGVCYLWRDIEYAFHLPVPDKAQVQHNYVLLPRASHLPSKTQPAPAAPPPAEPLVFTVPATAPKQGTIGGSEAQAAAAVSDTYRRLFHWALGRRLGPVGVVSADANKFHSVVRQPHRPSERAVHVAGFRGSKDGYLFFLENGILWGFKKPLLFLPLTRIAAVSYTSVLQITFNMVVEVLDEVGDATEEVEFGMLDQRDYAAIDGYVRANRLQDRSLAEQRGAKLQLAENRRKAAGEGEKGIEGEEVEGRGDEGEGDDGLTELERAEREAEMKLQDEEDEEEEDYDPGSEGESDGSGSSEDEDENEENEGDEGDEEGGQEEAEDEDDEGGEDDQGDEEEQEKNPMPVRSGWSSLNHARTDVDMEERFDVVG